jgi:hypothetical protein
MASEGSWEQQKRARDELTDPFGPAYRQGRIRTALSLMPVYPKKAPPTRRRGMHHPEMDGEV